MDAQLIDQVTSLASDVGAARLQLTVWEFNRAAREVFERARFTATTTTMVANPELAVPRPRSGAPHRLPTPLFWDTTGESLATGVVDEGHNRGYVHGLGGVHL